MSEFCQEEDTVSSSDAPNPRKRKGLAKTWFDVWDDFDRIKTGRNTISAICKLCKKVLTGRSESGTTHLRNHRNRCRKKNNKEEEEEVPTHVFSQVESRKDLASMIILHEYPLSIVEHAGFRKFVAGLNPEFKFISRNTVKKDIFKIYDVEKEKTSKLLETVDRVAIITDMWSAKPTKKGFMAITAHFIDEKWRLQNRILTFVYVPVPHNKEALSNAVLESFMVWNIDRKISAITVDNASTNDAMVEIIMQTLRRSSLMFDGKLFHMCCCAHILNLIVKDGLEVVGSKIDRIRRSCVFWKSTQTKIEKFEAAAIQLNISVSKGLETDVKTRWNSTYEMLRSALVYKDVFVMLKLRERSYDCLPSEDDWVLAEDICERLKLFSDATDLFSGTNYPTANCYFPKICDIKLELTKWLDSPSDEIKEMASKMVGKCNKYWSDCHLLMGVACVLDPRFKMKIVEFYFRKIYADNSEVEIEKIREARYNLFAEYQSRSDVNRSGEVRSSSRGISLDEHDSLSNFDLYVSESTTSSESELDLYLKENLVSRKIELDILKWWDAQKSFPILQKMARDILVVQVSTVASKSTFSASGRLITPHRSRLHQSTLKALMCARSWLWSDLKDFDSGVDRKYLTTVVDEEEDPTDDVELLTRYGSLSQPDFSTSALE